MRVWRKRSSRDHITGRIYNLVREPFFKCDFLHLPSLVSIVTPDDVDLCRHIDFRRQTWLRVKITKMPFLGAKLYKYMNVISAARTTSVLMTLVTSPGWSSWPPSRGKTMA